MTKNNHPTPNKRLEMGEKTKKPQNPDFNLDYWTGRLREKNYQKATYDLIDVLADMEEDQRNATVTALLLKLGWSDEKFESTKHSFLDAANLRKWENDHKRRKIQHRRQTARHALIAVLALGGLITAEETARRNGLFELGQDVGPVKIQDGSIARKVFYRDPRILDRGERETAGLFEETHCAANNRRTRTLYLPHEDRDGKGVGVVLEDTWTERGLEEWENWGAEEDLLEDWIQDIELIGISERLRRYAEEHPEKLDELPFVPSALLSDDGLVLKLGPVLPNMNNTGRTWLTDLPENACDPQ